MWHRRLVERGASEAQRLNFLWQADGRPVYVMDNHLGALWCWLRELAPDEPYRLVHIDEHLDGATLGEAGPAELASLDGVSLDEHTAVRATAHPMFSDAKKPPLVRWDNYIEPLFRLRPRLTRAAMVAWGGGQHLDTSGLLSFPVDEWKPLQLLERPGCVMSRDDDCRILLNIDVDFFFAAVGGEGRARRDRDVPWLSSKALAILLDALADLLEPRDIVTIALSPETSGGWAPAEKMGRAIARGLRVPWPRLPSTTA